MTTSSQQRCCILKFVDGIEGDFIVVVLIFLLMEWRFQQQFPLPQAPYPYIEPKTSSWRPSIIT